MDAVNSLPDVDKNLQNNRENAMLEKFWQNELTIARKLRDSRELAWRASRRAFAAKQNRLYKSRYDSVDTASVDGILDPSKQPFRVSNAIHYSNTEIMASNIVAEQPVINVGGTTDDTNLMAVLEKLIQVKMNALVKKLKMPKTLRSFIYDCLLFNIGIIKTGFSLTGTHRASAPKNSPFAIRISPFNYLVDAEAADDDSARWQGEEYFIDKAEFYASDFINKERVKDMFKEYLMNPEGRQDITLQTELSEGTATGVEDSELGTIGEGDVSITQRIRCVDVYDKTARKILTFAFDDETSSVILIRKADFPSYVKDSPFTTCIFNITPDNYYGFSDYEVIESKLKEIDKIEQRLLEFTKAMIPKYLFDKSAVNPAEMESFIHAEMLKVIGVNGASTPISQMLFPIMNAQLPKENFQLLVDLRQQINADLGITEYMKGQSQGKTATEAAIIDSASKTRSSKRQNIFDEALTEVLQKIYDALEAKQFDKLWVDEPGKYPLIGRDPNTGKLTFEVDPVTKQVVFEHQRGFFLTKDMLKPFNVSVEKGSTSANKSLMDKQVAMNLYQSTKGDPNINQIEVLKFMLGAFKLDSDRFINKQQQAPQLPAPQAGLPPNGAPPASVPGTEGQLDADMLNALTQQINPQNKQ